MISIYNKSLSEASLRIILAVFAYTFIHVIYRVYFHPLSHIPGPKLAASTDLYKTYYSYHRSNPLYKQITKLHAKYGPVIRIGVNEVHLSNPENFEKIHYVGSKYTKDGGLYQAFGIGYSGFVTESNAVHRIRRGAMSPMFTRKMVLDLENVVQDKAEKLSAAVKKALGSGESVDLFHGFRAVSVDVITDFAFDRCSNFLDRADFGANFFTTVQKANRIIWILQQWPLLRKIILSVPRSIAGRMSAALKEVFDYRKLCLDYVLVVKAKMDAGELDANSKPTLFQKLLMPSPNLGYVVPSPKDLSDEAYTVLGAAADTTGNALTTASWYICNNPNIYQKLTAELKQAFPDPDAKMDLVAFEKLPYLTNIIKEGLRLSFGVVGRLPRVVPEGGALFDGYKLPQGTVVGMSAWNLHHNPEYFESPQTFNPDRWADTEKLKIMEKAFIPFGKGSRMCVGMQLAYSELYITLGTLFRRFENMQGNVLTEEDRTIVDCFASCYPLDATKFHVSARVE